MSQPRNVVLSAGATIVMVGSRFALLAIAARRLSESGFGQFAYAMWLVDIAFLACSLGAAGTVSRYASEFRGDESKLAEFMGRWRRRAVAVPLLSVIAVVTMARLSGLEFGLESLAALALWAMLQAGWALQTAALTGSQRFDKIVVANMTAAAVMLVGISVMPLPSGGLWSLFALMASAAMTAILIGFPGVRGLGAGVPVAMPAAQWRSIRVYGFNMWLTPLLWSLLWSRGEFPIVRALAGDQGAAHYAAAMTVFGGAVQAMTLGVYGVMPHLTHLLGEGHVQRAVKTAENVMNLQLLTCGCVGLLLICFGPELMGLAFGYAYSDAAGMLVILGSALPAMALATQNHLLQIATDGRFSRDTSLLGVVVLMGLAMVLVSVGGLPGAALARALTVILLGLITVFFVRHRWTPSSISIRNLLIVLGACLGGAWAVEAIGDQRLLERAGVFMIGVIVIGSQLRIVGGPLVLLYILRRLTAAAKTTRVDESLPGRKHTS